MHEHFATGVNRCKNVISLHPFFFLLYALPSSLVTSLPLSLTFLSGHTRLGALLKGLCYGQGFL